MRMSWEENTGDEGTKSDRPFPYIFRSAVTGIMTHYLANRFRMITGVDIDEEALRYASRQGRCKSAAECYLASDAMAMPFQNDSFDAAVCSCL